MTVSGDQLGEVLASWAAQDDDMDRPLVLYACETGRQPDIAGLPVAQHVANRTGRSVYAPTSPVGMARDEGGDLRPVLMDRPDGPGRWRVFAPEPSGGDLDRLARDAGLHTGLGPADPFVRTRTLQQLRTLRDVLGPDAEQHTEIRELLAGLAYVDRLRWADPDSRYGDGRTFPDLLRWREPDGTIRYDDARMTPDLLRRMVRDHVEAHGAPATEPTREQYFSFLLEAVELRDGEGQGLTAPALQTGQPERRPLATGLDDPVDVPREARAIGVPRAGLPALDAVVSTVERLAADTGVTLAADVLAALPQRLLSNYRYLVEGDGPTERGGLVVPLGPVEALISLNPTDPREVSDPEGSFDGPATAHAPGAGQIPNARQETRAGQESGAGLGTASPAESVPDKGKQKEPGTAHGPKSLLDPRSQERDRFHSNEVINGVFHIGSDSMSHSGPTGAWRANLSASYGVGLGGGLNAIRVGAGVSGTLGANSRTTSAISDAEAGHVEDTRAESKLIAYRPGWSVSIRKDPERAWRDITPVEVATEPADRLLVWTPEHYLKKAPEQIVAIGDAVRARAGKVPAYYYASGLSGMPALADNVLTALRRRGVALGIGRAGRDELLQKLWNLDARLDIASEDGYRFSIRGEDGHLAAVIRLHAVRQGGETRVGETSASAHLENVRTNIKGSNGSMTVSNSSSVTFVNVTADAVPLPFTQSALHLNAAASLSLTSSNFATVSAGRAGLWVDVPRFSGRTNGYAAEFELSAEVHVPGKPPTTTNVVTSRGLLRMPEHLALEHGLPVDLDALNNADAATTPDPTPGPTPAPGVVTPVPPAPTKSVGYAPGLLKSKDRLDTTSPHSKLPHHVALGKGIGMGLVDVSAGTVRSLREQVVAHLEQNGFLPEAAPRDADGHPIDGTPAIRGTAWYANRSRLDRQIKNAELIDKYFSLQGFESHFDHMRQDALVLRLTVPRGVLGVNGDTDAVRISISARPSGTEPQYLGTTEDYQAVNLAMGMGTAGLSTSGNTRLSLSARFNAAFERLIGGGFGVDLFRQIGATQSASHLHNRPELLEYPGVLHKHRLFDDYTVTMEYEHSGVRGTARPGTRDHVVQARNQEAVAYLPPLGDTSDPGVSNGRRLSPEVLNRGVVYYVDASGMQQAVAPALRPLLGPQGNADAEVRTFLDPTMLRAFFTETAHGVYTSDQFFDTGLVRDTFGAVDVRSTLGEARFAGATTDKYVIGKINLTLDQTNTSDNNAKGIRFVQADVTVGGPTDGEGMGHVQGGMDAARTLQWNTSTGNGRTGGDERIQLDFNRAYAFAVDVDFDVHSRLEKRSKLPVEAHRSHHQRLKDRRMLFLLPEPLALDDYSKGNVPVSDRQLVDVLNRWTSDETKLAGDLVAGVLTRWSRETPQDTLDALDVRLTHDRRELAQLLHDLHERRELIVFDNDTRKAFNETFGLNLGPLTHEETTLDLPEYLTRFDPDGNHIGFSGITKVTFDGGGSTYSRVLKTVEAAAPGLLATDPTLWDGNGRRIGGVQGGINALQALLAPAGTSSSGTTSSADTGRASP